MLAIVVFPIPGGPHNIIEGTLLPAMAVRSMLPFPVRCSWPTRSFKLSGRSRSASGGSDIEKILSTVAYSLFIRNKRKHIFQSYGRLPIVQFNDNAIPLCSPRLQQRIDQYLLVALCAFSVPKLLGAKAAF